MSGPTPIEWTERSWNPIVGCSIVSPGCTHCYAMRMAARIEAMGNAPHYAGMTKASKAGAVWTGKITMAPANVLFEPLRRRKPTTWFVNSMGDLFHESVPDAWIDRVFAVMALAPQHTFQVLTKRSARMRAYLSAARAHPVGLAALEMTLNAIAADPRSRVGEGCMLQGDIIHLRNWPLPNVWLGVSAEDQRRADERVPDLLATPAAVRFVSAEPLLGPIDFERLGNLASLRAALPGIIAREERGRPSSGAGSIYGAQIDAVGSPGSSITYFQTPDHMGGFTAASPRQWPRLDWIIVGGESGPGARPMHPDWARLIRDQCAAAGVPFFFKQWGEWREAHQGDEFDTSKGRLNKPPAFIVKPDDGTVHCFLPTNADPRCQVMLEVGKKRAGRLLDGVLHNAMPERAA